VKQERASPLRLSIIIPALNEEASIVAMLQRLQAMRRRGHEVIVVDGGSSDETVVRATALADQIIHSKSGRARQMNAGAEQAHGDLLWFLHADTWVPEEGDILLSKTLEDQKARWGRFDVRLSGRHPLFWLIARMMNLRSCLTRIATGDQGIFVHRALFTQVRGYPNQPLMEDIALSKRLKKFSKPLCIDTPLITSSRRWESRGILRTMFLMWRLRFYYALGVDPVHLARLYR